jgi:AcrR family transcriptional regulator
MADVAVYHHRVPKLWDETIEAHRRAVRDATLDTTAELVAEHGLTAVTMSRIAEKTGIGRATLYKYFPDVESILSAWHERQIATHLEHLTAARDKATGPRERLEAVLHAYALIQRQSAHHHRHSPDLAALLHRGDHVAGARHHLRALVGELIEDAATAGEVRTDVPAGELAAYCLHALTAAGTLPSKDAAHRLAEITLDGLRPHP